MLRAALTAFARVALATACAAATAACATREATHELPGGAPAPAGTGAGLRSAPRGDTEVTPSRGSRARPPAEPPPADMVFVPGGASARHGAPGEPSLGGGRGGAFYLDRTEVTQRRYAKCVIEGACRAPLCEDGPTRYEPTARPDHPVVCVDWERARAYCEWAGKRLPKEVEWEWAARGGDDRRYPWGDEEPTCERANIRACGHGAALRAGGAPEGASSAGALDMAGNVWEWVDDWYSGSAAGASGAAGSQKVLRGGGFRDGPDALLVAARAFAPPAESFAHVGFRCARSAEGDVPRSGRATLTEPGESSARP